MAEVIKTWIDEMIERQSLPKEMREETTTAFCERNKISRQDYYYQLSKPSNQKKILEITLNKAKNEVPEVMDTLIQNAKKGKERSIEMYLDYILKLAKNLDITSDGKPLYLPAELIDKYELTQDSKTSSTMQEKV